MSDAFAKVQFMAPPSYGGAEPVPVGAVKAGSGIEILPDGTINATAGGGTISKITCTNGIQGGGSTPEVFLGLLPPAGTTIGGVKTVEGSGISIDSEGVIRAIAAADIEAGTGILVTDLGQGAYRVTLKDAGTNALGLGGVYVESADQSGLILQNGKLSLSPPVGIGLGGVRAGTGCSIAADGTLTATGTGGTITGVGAGTGLGGGGVTGAVTMFLKPPSGTTIGGVYAGQNVTIAADGQISIADQAGVQTITAAPNGAIQITGTATNPIIGAYAAGLTSTGVCRLSSAIDSTEFEYVAANPLAVKTVADLANTKLPLAGGSMSGAITFTAGQTFPGTVSSGAFTQLGGILVGDTSPLGYAQLPLGNDGQYLTVNSAAPLGVEWTTSPANPTLQTVTDAGSVTDNEIRLVNGNTGVDSIELDPINGLIYIYPQAAQDVGLYFGPSSISFGNSPGLIQASGPTPSALLFDGTNGTSLKTAQATTPVQLWAGGQGGGVATPQVSVTGASTTLTNQLIASGISYPTVDGPAGAVLVTDGAGTLSFSTGLLSETGGTMTGDITFAGTQTFPGVLNEGSISAIGAIDVGGTLANPILSVDTATTAQLGVVQPDGTTITVDGNGVISALSGSNPTTTLGDLIYASASGTPGTLGRLGIGANGTLLGVNAGLPEWRTPLQLGLLTTSVAASIYAPLDTPSFTGPVTVNGGGSSGANALTVSGGNLVLATSYTPPSSSSTGSVGELAWDANYLYFCYLPNTWGRVAVDLTPF